MESNAPKSSAYSEATNSRLAVFMFTDLVDSTALKDTLTTAGYLPLLRRHDQLLRRAVASAGGRLQQDTGDGCIAVFPTSSDAVKAALNFQWWMAAEPWPMGARLESRVGIHLGEVATTEVRQDGGRKIVGMPVDLAARVMSLARGGQILMTKGAFNDARQFLSMHPDDAKIALKWVSHGLYKVKGSADKLEVFEVGVVGRSPLLAPPDSEKVHRIEGSATLEKTEGAEAPRGVRSRRIGRRVFLAAGACALAGGIALYRPWQLFSRNEHAVGPGPATTQILQSPPVLKLLTNDDKLIETFFFSSDEKHLVAAGSETAKIWTRDSDGWHWMSSIDLNGKWMYFANEQRPLKTDANSTLNRKVGWSANHRFLLAGGHLFDLSNPTLEPVPVHVEEDLNWLPSRHGVRISPNGNLVAIAETLKAKKPESDTPEDFGVTLIGTRSSSIKARVGSGHKNKVGTVAFSPNGLQLLTGDNDGLIVVWDISDPAKPLFLQKLEGHKGAIHRIFFSSDAKAARLCTQDYENQTIVWEAENPAGGARMKFQFLDRITDRKERVGENRDQCNTAAMNAAGTRLVVGYSQNCGLLYRDVTSATTTATLLTMIGEGYGFGFRADDVAMSADGRRVVAGSYVGDPSILPPNPKTELVNRYEADCFFGKVYIWEPGSPKSQQPMRHVGKKERVSAVAITADGRTVAAAEEGTVYVWDFER